jgi:hypothetical protein
MGKRENQAYLPGTGPVAQAHPGPTQQQLLPTQKNEQLASFDLTSQLTPQMMMKLHDCMKYNKLCAVLESHQAPFSILNLFLNSEKFGEVLQNPQLRKFFEQWFTELKLALDCKATSSAEITPEIKQEKLIHLPRVRQTKSTLLPPHIPLSIYIAMKTLIFDLDETLIHNKEYSSDPVDAVIPYQYPDSTESEVKK